jgi:hypothetical protein
MTPRTIEILESVPAIEPNDYTGTYRGTAEHIADCVHCKSAGVRVHLHRLIDQGAIAVRKCYPVDDNGKTLNKTRVNIYYRVIEE